MDQQLQDHEGERPAESGTLALRQRFRVELSDDGLGTWQADIYDLEDHGPAIPYASVTGALESVLRHATHYVRMAA